MRLQLKKLISAGLVLSLGLLTACSGTPQATGGTPTLDPKDPVAIEVWHYYNGLQKTAFDAMVSEFNETAGLEQGIIVEAFSLGNVNGLIEKITDAAEKKVGADEVPNMFAAYADTAHEVDKLDLLVDLTPYFTAEELAQYRPEFIEEGDLSGDGTLKIFPMAKSVELLMVNTTDFQKFADATGARLEDLATIEGVTAAAQAYYDWTDSLTPEPDDGKAFFGRDAMANYMIAGCRQLGGELFHVDASGVTLNADPAVFRQLWDNYYVPYINGYFAAFSRFRSDDAHRGDIIALVGSSSGAAYFPSDVSVDDIDSYPIDCAVMPAPVFAGGEPYAIQQGAGMAVTKSTPEEEYACAVFLKWFTDAQHNVGFAVGSGGYLPVKNDALDMALIRDALDSQDAEGFQRMEQTFQAALTELETCTMYTTRAFDGGNAARALLTSSMSDLATADRQSVLALMDGGLSRQEAVAQYDTDAHFDEWYQDLVAQLTATCKG